MPPTGRVGCIKSRYTLFEYPFETTEAEPEAFIGFSAQHRSSKTTSPTPTRSFRSIGTGRIRGLPALRQNVLDRSNLDLPLESVLITAGAAEANYLALRQLVGPGDKIVTETPGWPQVGVMAEAIGAELIEVPRQEEDGWSLPLDALEETAQGAKLIFLTNPNNPTGRLIPEAELREIAEIARRADAWLLVDEVYAGLEWAAPVRRRSRASTRRGSPPGRFKALGLQGSARVDDLPDQGAIRDASFQENASEIMNIMGEVIAEIAMREDRYAAKLRRPGKPSPRWNSSTASSKNRGNEKPGRLIGLAAWTASMGTASPEGPHRAADVPPRLLLRTAGPHPHRGGRRGGQARPRARADVGAFEDASRISLSSCRGVGLQPVQLTL